MGNRLIRYSVAFVLLAYGFAKLNGSQFTILDSELDKPMGQVTGFWLTWYYFGFSPFYGTFLALVQIVGATLLTFPRTTLLGACILAPMLANIILIDIFYGIDPGATGVAILLLAGVIGLIAPHRRELIALFWPVKSGPERAPLHLLKWSIRVAMVCIAFTFTYWVANFNNRFPTPIDGAWDLIRVEPSTLAEQVPSTLFFEYNRASMAVFKTRDGAYKTHHFELDRDTKRIRIWESWQSKGSQLFEGSYALAMPELTLSGSLKNAGDVTLQLRRRPTR